MRFSMAALDSALVCFAAATCAAQQGASPEKKQLAAYRDPSPHTIQLVTVDKDVKLEVLDWGGTGRPIVLLAGLGNTAHVFDDFAPKLTPQYHVYKDTLKRTYLYKKDGGTHPCVRSDERTNRRRMGGMPIWSNRIDL